MRRRVLPTGTLRFRIAFGFVAGALAVSGAVAVSTYVLAQRYLTRQRVDASIRQSFNSLRFATEYIARPDAIRRPEQLVAFLQTRGNAGVLVNIGRRSVSSSVALALETVPRELASAVQHREVGHIVRGGDPRRLTFGSLIPGTHWELYLVYPLADLDSTLGLLARILLATAGLATGIAAVLGWRVAGRTIEPLRQASEAARRVAEGLTDLHTADASHDELGVLAASFNEMAGALQERIARERRFVADASHELRTPLTGLKASVDYLAQRPEELPQRLRPVAALAADEVRSLQRLVDDLLELSRVEAGAVQLLAETIELGAFAEEVARRRAPGCPVEIVRPSEPLRVRVDKARLERIIGNLVENAMVHGEGRDVRIEVSGPDGDHASITVSDAGPGIPFERVSRIFERFWRADGARQRGAGSGAGLGLAIARENANLIGADIDVVSDPGGGSRFTVRLGESA